VTTAACAWAARLADDASAPNAKPQSVEYVPSA
jgi:hypothetical protein